MRGWRERKGHYSTLSMECSRILPFSMPRCSLTVIRYRNRIGIHPCLPSLLEQRPRSDRGSSRARLVRQNVESPWYPLSPNPLPIFEHGCFQSWILGNWARIVHKSRKRLLQCSLPNERKKIINKKKREKQKVVRKKLGFLMSHVSLFMRYSGPLLTS